MIKDILLQLKYKCSQLKFRSKKDSQLKLEDTFNRLKAEDFDFENIELYFRRKDNTTAHQILSDKTCNDLDFDDFFMLVDRTSSRVGQQYFYNHLRLINYDKTQVELNERIIAELTTNSTLRYTIQKKLEKLNTHEAYHISTLFQEEHLKPPKWYYMIKILSFASLSSLVLGIFYPKFWFVLLGIFCINFIIHYWNKNHLVQYVGSIPQLLRLNRVASYLFSNPLLRMINPEVSKSIKLIGNIKHRMSFFQLEARLQGELEIVVWFVFEIIKTMFLLEPLLLFGALKKLDNKRHEIEQVFRFVGHVDMLIAIAYLRKGLDEYCLPHIDDKNAIGFKDLKHPLVVNCIPNSLKELDRSILLTGSNMSGKTTFIRAIGLNIISGLCINTCFAKSMHFPVLKIFSAIRITDDLSNHKSYYFEEVLTIKEMLKESLNTNNNLFLLDELFKGTNTVERISAGKSILSALNTNNNKVLVSTHDIELTDMLSSEYDLYHFNETVHNKNVGFDYKLKKGKLKNRNAIRILEINGYPLKIISEANKIARELTETL